MGIKDIMTKAVANSIEVDGDTTLNDVVSAETEIADCEKKWVTILQDIAATEIAMGKEPDDPKARKLAERLDELEKDRKVNAARRKVADEKLQAAKAQLQAVNRASLEKATRRN